MIQNPEPRTQERASLLDLTLAQQMQITQTEIDHRCHLLGIRDHDIQILRKIQPIITENLDKIVDEFYSIQRNEKEISLLIGDQETFRRLHASMKYYIVELFGGYCDAQYVNKRLRIGMVHKRIGVSPKLYISAINLLGTILEKNIAESFAEKTIDDDLRLALHKILMFDVQLVFDTYIRSLLSAVESAKEEVERYATSLERIVTERTQQLEEMARVDALTGLGNQRSFYEEIRREMARSERSREPLVLMYFDLNCFKPLNDSKGHLIGDKLLATVGRCLKDTARETDYCFRYGGDEFCVILTNTTIPMASTFIDRLIATFEKEETYGISFSIGLAQANTDDISTVENLIRMADTNMYEAKALSKINPGHHIYGDAGVAKASGSEDCLEGGPPLHTVARKTNQGRKPVPRQGSEN